MDSSSSSVLDINLAYFHVFVLKHGDDQGESGAQIQMKMKSVTVARAREVESFYHIEPKFSFLARKCSLYFSDVIWKTNGTF